MYFKKRKCSLRLEIVQPCRKLHFILLLGSEILTPFPVLVPNFLFFYFFKSIIYLFLKRRFKIFVEPPHSP